MTKLLAFARFLPLAWALLPVLGDFAEDARDPLNALPKQYADQVTFNSYSAHVQQQGADIHDLAQIPSDNYVTLTHPAFPHHSARFKKANFCDPTVKFVSLLSFIMIVFH